ncbi:MAG: hypothetical protein DRH21_02170 [Deltaproteobacteria bacterium]|nr:MAG: hypothetical protein DRH21_02170 [Deltaproteobacteria bacterium]
MRKFFFLMVVLGFSILLPCTVVANFQKTKIAVLDFQLQGKGYETSDMGKIVAEWFITSFVNEGRFDVIERGLLTKILKEQNLIMTGTVDSDIATQLGKLLGVKVIISGSVMRFQDIIEINARIIDVESASIISAESIKGSSTTEVRKLVKQMSEKIIKNFPLEGYIVYVGVNSITIDLGKVVGVKPGMQFIVFKEGDVIRHPKTGQILDVEKIKTGIIKIISVNEKIAKANIIKEKFPGSIEYGQRVKSFAEDLTPIMTQLSVDSKSQGVKQAMEIKPKREHLVITNHSPQKKKKSPYISPQKKKKSLYITKYIKVLRSNDSTQKVRAAKEIFKSYSHDPQLLCVVNEELLRGYQINVRDRQHIDAMAWLCKILGASGQTKYKATLKRVAQEAPSRKLKKYARKSLSKL